MIAKNWQLMKTGDTCSVIILVCPQGLLSYFACNKRMPEDLYSLCIDHMYKYTQILARHAIYVWLYISAPNLLQFQSHFSTSFSCSYLSKI